MARLVTNCVQLTRGAGALRGHYSVSTTISTIKYGLYIILDRGTTDYVVTLELDLIYVVL